jgi:hypothetical protein
MASHFRLRVLLPVAILGLFGLGVGAFAFGRAPSAGDGALPPLPTHPTTTTPASQDTELALWAENADAWCATVDARLTKVPTPKNPEDLDLALTQMTQIVDDAVPTFVKLGWPKGQKASVLKLQGDLRGQAQAIHGMFAALRRADQFAFERAFRRLGELGVDWDSRMGRVGAKVCAAEAADVATARRIAKYGSAGAALSSALLHKRVVVVLFYAPGDDYDTIQTRETRAGALDANAGFLALDVTKNDEVAALASEYDVREAPSTLIFVGGPKVFYRVEGYLDREAVAQAATDARR